MQIVGFPTEFHGGIVDADTKAMAAACDFSAGCLGFPKGRTMASDLHPEIPRASAYRSPSLKPEN